MTKRFPVLCIAALLSTPAWALTGHILSGVGAVDASLAGSGLALSGDALGALNANPALLTHLDGYRFEFSAEFIRAKNTVSSTVGPFSGTTKDSGPPAVIPAFGWTHHDAGSNVAFGMGFLGVSGFGNDYRQDSNNPILSPQPYGAGRVYSKYELLKIPISAAFQVSPNLSVGVSLNVERATLAATPAGFAAPDCTNTGVCYLAKVDGDSRFGFGGTLGVQWDVTPTVGIGASYISKTNFQKFEWNTTHANPLLADYGTARTITFKANAPAIAGIGIAFRPTPALSFALDGKWYNFAGTEGFGKGANNLGWKNAKAYAAGVEFRPSPGIALRAGYNHTDNPIPDELSFPNIIAPAIFKELVSVGFGVPVWKNMDANFAYYRVFKSTGSGPILSPSGPVPGTQVTNKQEVNSAVMTMSFHF